MLYVLLKLVPIFEIMQMNYPLLKKRLIVINKFQNSPEKNIDVKENVYLTKAQIVTQAHRSGTYCV